MINDYEATRPITADIAGGVIGVDFFEDCGVRVFHCRSGFGYVV